MTTSSTSETLIFGVIFTRLSVTMTARAAATDNIVRDWAAIPL